MSRRAARALGLALAALAFAGSPACGKKGPLRLPEHVPVEQAAVIRAGVRERRVTLTFRTPRRRLFPEREEPWVLARVLRRAGTAPEFTEVGTVLDTQGLPFDAELSWTDDGRAPGERLAYRVEFRDAARRRKALTPILALSWASVPAAPGALRAEGGEGSVSLGWEAPAGTGFSYRVYRREAGAAAKETKETGEAPALASTATAGYVDSRVVRGREYCYAVRAVLAGQGAEVEGPAGEERCARTEDATPPPAPAGLRVAAEGGVFQLTWEPVAAPDLLGYEVYRAVDGGALERVTPRLVEGTAFRDAPPGLASGTRVRWAVTAVDNSTRRNESSFSATVEATAP